MTCCDTENPFFLRIRTQDGIFQTKVIITRIEHIAESMPIGMYCDDVKIITAYRESPPKITLEMLVVE